MSSVTERLANLSIPTVLITVAVLLLLRFVLLKQKTPVTKSIAEIAESLAVAMALVFLIIRPFIVQAFFIPSESMVPTLLIDDHILVNKFIYRFREPRLGDVVVFKAPSAATMPDINRLADQNGLTGRERESFVRGELSKRENFIKRVIGVHGDVVRITPGYVVVGETQYNHDDLRGKLSSFAGTYDQVKVKLANGEVFVNGKLVTHEEVAAALGDPNAKVKVVPGQVYINSKPIKEQYIAEDPDDPYPGDRAKVEPSWLAKDKKGQPAVKIPKGKLLVMGDNRNFSNDARFWGLLDRNRILGKAMFKFWPLNRIGWVH